MLRNWWSNDPTPVCPKQTLIHNFTIRTINEACCVLMVNEEETREPGGIPHGQEEKIHNSTVTQTRHQTQDPVAFIA